jgi:hypothetical protein
MKNLVLLYFLILFCFVDIQAQTYRIAPQHYPPMGERLEFIQQPTEPIFSINPELNRFPYNDSSNCFNKVYYLRHHTNIENALSDTEAYYLTGSASHWDVLHTVLFRIKTDLQGNILWAKEDSIAYGCQYTGMNHCLTKLSDGSILAAAHLYLDMQTPKDYECILPIYHRFDKDGNTLFFRLRTEDTTGRRFGFWPHDLVAEPDGGFTAAGFVGSQTRTWSTQSQVWMHDTTYIAIISYDSLGNETRRALHYVGGQPRTPGVDGLHKLGDGGYLISGTRHINYPVNKLRCNYNMRLDSNFNFVSIHTHGQMAGEYLNRNYILPSINGGYVFAVNRADTPVTVNPNGTFYTYYYHVGRMDPAFNIIKDTVFRVNSTVEPYELVAGIIVGQNELKNGDIVIAVRYYSGALVFWLDEELNLYRIRHIWHYPGVYPAQWVFNLSKAMDEGIMVMGHSSGLYRGGFLAKTDSLGFTLPNGGDTLMHIGIEEPGAKGVSLNLVVFPNPASTQITLQLKNGEKLPRGSLQIFNIQGIMFEETRIPANTFHQHINITNYPPGLYIGRISGAEGASGSFRFVRE